MRAIRYFVLGQVPILAETFGCQLLEQSFHGQVGNVTAWTTGQDCGAAGTDQCNAIVFVSCAVQAAQGSAVDAPTHCWHSLFLGLVQGGNVGTGDVTGGSIQRLWNVGSSSAPINSLDVFHNKPHCCNANACSGHSMCPSAAVHHCTVPRRCTRYSRQTHSESPDTQRQPCNPTLRLGNSATVLVTTASLETSHAVLEWLSSVHPRVSSMYDLGLFATSVPHLNHR